MNPSVHPQADGTLGLAARHAAGSDWQPHAVVPSSTERPIRQDSTEARLGACMALSLTLSASPLPADVSERLRFAREFALARAAQRRHSERNGALQQASTLTLRDWLRRWLPVWQGAAAWMPLLVLVGGLVLIDLQLEAEELHALADIDTLLLTDRLPPEAYSDPGFAEYLRSAPPP